MYLLKVSFYFESNSTFEKKYVSFFNSSSQMLHQFLDTDCFVAATTCQDLLPYAFTYFIPQACYTVSYHNVTRSHSEKHYFICFWILLFCFFLAIFQRNKYFRKDSILPKNVIVLWFTSLPFYEEMFHYYSLSHFSYFILHLKAQTQLAMAAFGNFDPCSKLQL